MSSAAGRGRRGSDEGELRPLRVGRITGVEPNLYGLPQVAALVTEPSGPVQMMFELKLSCRTTAIPCHVIVQLEADGGVRAIS